MTDVVAMDVGGTHARFARGLVAADGSIALNEPVVLETAAYDGPVAAWREYSRRTGDTLPHAAAIAIAGPVLGDRVPMTNCPWVLNISAFKEALELEAITVLNDFGAVAHAVARAEPELLAHVSGPDGHLPDHGTITVIGPGTGLGVAHIHRHVGGYHVQPTEGGHIGFAPQDAIDDAILAHLRSEHGRVATERVNAGPGIAAIYRALGGHAFEDDRTIWSAGLGRSDDLAALSVDRFCAGLGTVAGDFALAQGASAVVLAGGLGLKLREVLPASEFAARFCAKPRYEAMMAAIPVKLITLPQPGLFGAVAAFQAEHLR